MSLRPRPDLSSRELRRQAKRPALSRRRLRNGRLSPALVDAARRGVLTDSNTTRGTQGRQAVDRFAYSRRAAGTAPGETVRARLGHEVAVSRSISALLAGPARFEVLEGVTRLDAKRIARYHEVTRQLVNRRSYRGKVMTPERFRRLVSQWRPLSSGDRLLADPDAVIAILETLRAEDRAVFVYEVTRP
ncbi:MAG: hypothetical protein ABSD85_11755 [Acidimicrobiales bacterium]